MDVLDRIRRVETQLLDAGGKVEMWHTLQEAMAEIKRLRGNSPVTQPQANEMPADKPVAWSVLESPHSLLFFDGEETAREVAFRVGVGARPLYRKPQPTLTDDERDVLRQFATMFSDTPASATMRGLLARNDAT